MRKMILLLVGLVVCGGVHAADTAVELVTQSFPLERVRLLDGPFKKAMEKNREVLLKFDVDRMLWPYHERAGMPTKGERYGGWAKKDCVGQISGHYLSALSLMYAASGQEEFKKRADYMVSELARIQKKYGNGYTGPVRPEVWDNTFDGSIEVHKWGLGTGYVPWYVMHKTFAGLIDAYQLTGNKQALSVVCLSPTGPRRARTRLQRSNSRSRWLASMAAWQRPLPTFTASRATRTTWPWRSGLNTSRLRTRWRRSWTS
jgi:hypothetical protein